MKIAEFVASAIDDAGRNRVVGEAVKT